MDLQHAIQHRLHIEFVYDGHPRTVRPSAYGLHVTTGHATLRGYQVGGTSSSQEPPCWRLFTVSRMSDLVVTDEVFADDPPGYTRGDAALDPIVAEL